MKLNIQGKELVTVINAYAPTSGTEDEREEQFYHDIERAMADGDSKYIITGDSNAKLGTKTKEDLKSMAAFGTGERNERGDRLTELAEEHKLTIANTLFQKPQNKILELGVTRWRNKKPDRFCLV